MLIRMSTIIIIYNNNLSIVIIFNKNKMKTFNKNSILHTFEKTRNFENDPHIILLSAETKIKIVTRFLK